MMTLWNAIGIIIAALSGAALGYLVSAMIDEVLAKKR